MKANLYRGLLMAAQIYLACILAGCMALQGPQIVAGDVLSLNSGTVQNGIRTALGVAPGVARYLSPDQTTLLVSWPLSGYQAWTFVTNAGRGLEGFITSQLSGQIANVKDWGSLKNLAEALKWIPIPASQAAAFLEGLGSNVAIIYRANPMMALTWALAPYLEIDPYQLINPGVDS